MVKLNINLRYLLRSNWKITLCGNAGITVGWKSFWGLSNKSSRTEYLFRSDL